MSSSPKPPTPDVATIWAATGGAKVMVCIAFHCSPPFGCRRPPSFSETFRNRLQCPSDRLCNSIANGVG